MAYNLKKKAKDDAKVYDKHLGDNREELGNKVNTNPGNIDYEMQQVQKTHDVPPDDQITQQQLEAARTGTNNGITEKALNENKTLYNEKRTDKAYATDIKSNDLVSESYDQKTRKDFTKAENAQDRDTEFWDKYVGDQMLGKKTTITNNVQKSQLQNHKDRFKGLANSMPTDESQSTNRSRVNKPDKFYKMVEASLKRADAMLFHIHATAAVEGRDLTNTEKQQIVDINSGKIRAMVGHEKD